MNQGYGSALPVNAEQARDLASFTLDADLRTKYLALADRKIDFFYADDANVVFRYGEDPPDVGSTEPLVEGLEN